MDSTKQKRSFRRWVKRNFTEAKLLFRSIPSLAVAIYVVSVVVMNLMASKIIFKTDWIAIGGGVLISWIPFLVMDIVTKHFGAKSANRLSVLAIFVNLFCCLVFYIVTLIGKNDAFDQVFRSTWFILAGSTIAFFLSALTNNYSNEFIGKLFKKNPDGKLAYFVRTYVSTFVGQIIDNLAFLLPTYMLFAPLYWGPDAGWSFLQCFTCSVLCAIAEFVLGAIFTPLAYRINTNWIRDEVGKEYFFYLEEESL